MSYLDLPSCDSLQTNKIGIISNVEIIAFSLRVIKKSFQKHFLSCIMWDRQNNMTLF